MFKHNNNFIPANPDNFEPVTTVMAGAALYKLGSSLISGKQTTNPDVVEAAKQLSISRDTAWASGDIATIKAHNETVAKADGQFDNWKEEDLSLSGKRLWDFKIVDTNAKIIGVDSGFSTKPANWYSTSFVWMPYGSYGTPPVGPAYVPNSGNSNVLSAIKKAIEKTKTGAITTAESEAAAKNNNLFIFIGVGVVLLVLIILLIRR